MIQKLEHTNPTVANQIRSIWQVSYKVEADLLNAKVFPPLNRTLEEFINCENAFYGYVKNDTLAAVVEVIHNSEYTHIRSLVVDPNFFRQGIGKALVQFVLKEYDSNLFIVETGAANDPACALYENLGFELIEEFDTPFGIKKVKFEKRL